MTDEEKLTAVEEALDGYAELIAEARVAFADRFEDRLFAFLTASGTTGHIARTYTHFYDALRAAVGEERCDDINQEEWDKFEARQIANDPEVWELYNHGTAEELREFPTNWESARHPEALAEWRAKWRADREHEKNREEYARKFYGVKDGVA